jgi:hypothetical protein
MMIRKRLKGEVQYNDGQFAEIQTVETAGPESEVSASVRLHRLLVTD